VIVSTFISGSFLVQNNVTLSNFYELGGEHVEATGLKHLVTSKVKHHLHETRAWVADTGKVNDIYSFSSNWRVT